MRRAGSEGQCLPPGVAGVGLVPRADALLAPLPAKKIPSAALRDRPSFRSTPASTVSSVGIRGFASAPG
jgi:hypothetical protein